MKILGTSWTMGFMLNPFCPPQKKSFFSSPLWVICCLAPGFSRKCREKGPGFDSHRGAPVYHILTIKIKNENNNKGQG